LENAAGIQACALAAQLCSDQNLDLGAESCERTSEALDQDRCAVELACAKPITLDATADARAWLMNFGGVRCNRDDLNSPFACTCSKGALTSNYSLLAAGSELACGPFADFCLSGTTPVFGTDEVCLPGYFDTSSEGCQGFAACGRQMRLTDQVSLAQLADRFASCTSHPGGGSDCSCSDQDSAFLFQLSTPPNDASCESSVSNCNPNAVIKTTAPARCEPLAVDRNGDQCRGALSCVQDATVDDRSIVTQGSLVVVCGRNGPGKPWLCSCASQQETARVELGAGSASANDLQAFTQGAAACRERIGIRIGPSGDPIEPPDPFP